ncbi:hypothetical protein DM860_010123 [Cuscuta australis]|uniref:Cytochrome P450 n=1 Tax=Cuscuta australis TaxID=267555 RepID=A0A328DAH1_9ASTE|nr:hypothetical protein DM860_010123 [Cuscuta australis]
MENYFPWLWFLVIAYLFIFLALKTVLHLWWIPRRFENHFNKQGVFGPKYNFFFGNIKEIARLTPSSSHPMPLSHDILPRVLSFYSHWKKIYGSTFVVWFGTMARVTISDPTLLREIFISKSEYFEKNDSPPLVKKLEGDGLLNLKGEKWAHHRRLITPAFYLENLKLMVPTMGKGVREMLDKWSEMSKTATGKVEIDVCEWFERLTESVICHVIFGHRCEEDGTPSSSSSSSSSSIFQLQAQQMAYATEAFRKIFIPGHRFLPTEKNRTFWRLDKEVRRSLVRLIDERRRALLSPSGGRDLPTECGPKGLLDLMIKETCKNHNSNNNVVAGGNGASRAAAAATGDVVEECKTLFFAGKHTTSNLMAWTTVLLAMHPRWQELAREEVLRVCGAHDPPSKDDLANLKTLGMILNESLRLYPPIVAIVKRAKVDVQLGELKVPKGAELLVPIIAIHHDPTLWGNDVNEFNPARFARPPPGCQTPCSHPAMAFMPFGQGERKCVGQNLAILQAKLAMAMILQRFSFELAPSYQHSPTVLMLLQPQHGAPIVFHNL